MTDFDYEREDLVVLKRFTAPGDGGFVALCWCLISEQPMLRAHGPHRSEAYEAPLPLLPSSRAETSDELAPQVDAALALHNQILAVGSAGGYEYLRARPRLKVFTEDITRAYPRGDWLWENRIKRLEAIWLFDDAQRHQRYVSEYRIEAYGVALRITAMEGETPFGELTPELEQLKAKAKAGLDHDVVAGKVAEFGEEAAKGAVLVHEANDAEVFALMTGEFLHSVAVHPRPHEIRTCKGTEYMALHARIQAEKMLAED